MRIGCALLLILLADPALAHGDVVDVLGAQSLWTYDPWVIGLLYLSAVLYLCGTFRLWRRAGHGRGVRYWQAVCFWSGWTLLAVAVVSPLHWLGERLFVAHMIEHEVMMLLAAPLLAVARPIGAFLWAVPPRWRAALGRAGKRNVISASWRTLSNPLVASLLHALALWAWHMPALYNLALVSTTMHRLQHASFLLTALLFWWSLFFTAGRARGYGVAISCLFVTTLHTGALGVLLTLSPRLWYPRHGEFAAQWGLSAIEDQQLAGLVMWVPGGLIYTVIALALAARWIEQAGHAPVAESSYARAH